MFYSEKKELLRLRKENAELRAQVAKMVGERIAPSTNDGIFEALRFQVLSGSAMIKLEGPGTTQAIQAGDTYHINIPYRSFYAK